MNTRTLRVCCAPSECKAESNCKFRLSFRLLRADRNRSLNCSFCLIAWKANGTFILHLARRNERRELHKFIYCDNNLQQIEFHFRIFLRRSASCTFSAACLARNEDEMWFIGFCRLTFFSLSLSLYFLEPKIVTVIEMNDDVCLLMTQKIMLICFAFSSVKIDGSISSLVLCENRHFLPKKSFRKSRKKKLNEIRGLWNRKCEWNLSINRIATECHLSIESKIEDRLNASLETRKTYSRPNQIAVIERELRHGLLLFCQMKNNCKISWKIIYFFEWRNFRVENIEQKKFSEKRDEKKCLVCLRCLMHTTEIWLILVCVKK